MFIKHVSKHLHILGPNREFFDTEVPLNKDQLAKALEIQNRWLDLGDYLAAAYDALRAGGKPPEAPSWLNEEKEQSDTTSDQASSIPSRKTLKLKG